MASNLDTLSLRSGRHADGTILPHGRMRSPRAVAPRLSRGFTLLELLIVLALMSIVGLLAWRGLTTVSSSATHIEQPLNRTLVLTRAMAQLKLDAAAIATPTEIGFAPLSLTAERLTLVRHLDSEATGAAFQVVSYQVAAHALWRSASPPLHDTPSLRLAMQTLESEDPSKAITPSASVLTSHAQPRVTHLALVTRVQRIVWHLWLPQIGWTDDRLVLQRTYDLAMHAGSIFDHRTDVLPTALSLQLFTTDSPAPLIREVLTGP